MPGQGPSQAQGTTITFVNTGKAVLKKITFEVKYRSFSADLSRTIDDVGSFAPGVKITHNYDAYRGVSWQGSTPTSCEATSAS